MYLWFMVNFRLARYFKCPQAWHKVATTAGKTDFSRGDYFGRLASRLLLDMLRQQLVFDALPIR